MEDDTQPITLANTTNNTQDDNEDDVYVGKRRATTEDKHKEGKCWIVRRILAFWSFYDLGLRNFSTCSSPDWDINIYINRFVFFLGLSRYYCDT